ncbi:hypothetical protein BD410DRAFT_846911 [Rickenella mellea]|uniref:Uncharacterized protein n=1 Tax=Rickenella mellea TaxID=50990 RepID=A0A4Y7PDW5_9AGAM|nr:hypothetical protein BD410DRAFT_846911 [Rickenella mellea]
MAGTLVTLEELVARINMGVFRVENGDIFTSSNTDKLCNLAAPQLREDVDIPTVLKNCQVPIWSSPGFASLPFILVAPRWEGPLFGRLAQNHEVFPITRGTPGWHLAVPLQESWRRLEVALYDAIRTLETAEITFPLPFRFGYLKSHSTNGKARYHALQSRNAFLPLMATLSDAIAAYIPNPRSLHFETTRDELKESGPHWVNMLLKRGVNRAWVTLLEQSQVATFSREIRRVGVVIDPSNCPAHERRIDRLLLAHVPIWTWMGNGLPSFFRDKPICEIDVARRFRLTETQFAAVVSWPPPASSSTSVPTYAEPAAGSGQKPGETWSEFFARRALKNEQTKLNETEVQRQSRADRERNAETATIPSSRSRVFMWDDSERIGFLVRRLVYRSEIGAWWDQFSEQQRRYDGFRDEWDLCDEFGPGLPRLYDDDDIVFPDTGDNHIVNFQPDSTPPGSPAHQDQDRAAASHADMDAVYDVGINSMTFDVDQLVNVLHYRYGVHDTAYESKKALDEKKWGVICCDLTHTEDDQLSISWIVSWMQRGPSLGNYMISTHLIQRI